MTALLIFVSDVEELFYFSHQNDNLGREHQYIGVHLNEKSILAHISVLVEL